LICKDFAFFLFCPGRELQAMFDHLHYMHNQPEYRDDKEKGCRIGLFHITKIKAKFE